MLRDDWSQCDAKPFNSLEVKMDRQGFLAFLPAFVVEYASNQFVFSIDIDMFM